MSDVAGETIVVDETGKGDFQVEVKAGTSSFLMDEPVQAGGLGSGPNPYDLLSAAIGACALMTIRLYARRKQWPLERVRLKVTHHRDGLQAKDRFVREIELVGPVRHQRSLDRTGGLKNLAYNIRRLVTLERLAAA
jgi:putative redox protein